LATTTVTSGRRYEVKHGYKDQAKRRAKEHREDNPWGTGAPQRISKQRDREGAKKPDSNSSRRGKHGSESEGLEGVPGPARIAYAARAGVQAAS
jgi:hypothetical protein